MKATFTIAKHSVTGLPVHIKGALNRLKCNCICYHCDEKFEAIQGKIAWHYRHHKESTCPGNNETALHEYAKKVLLENDFVETVKQRIIYSNPQKETRTGIYYSDVSVSYLKKVIHFEIVVCHDFLNTAKETHYKLNNINCIRIDLTDPALLMATPQEIKYAVIQNTSNKNFIHWYNDKPEIRSTSSDTSSIGNWLIGSLILIAGFFLFRNGRPINRRKKFRR